VLAGRMFNPAEEYGQQETLSYSEERCEVETGLVMFCGMQKKTKKKYDKYFFNITLNYTKHALKNEKQSFNFIHSGPSH
jgi:hypothetical protein